MCQPPPPPLYISIVTQHFTWKKYILMKQDAREAVRILFSVLTKRICMRKTKFLMNIFKYCLKIRNCSNINFTTSQMTT